MYGRDTVPLLPVFKVRLPSEYTTEYSQIMLQWTVKTLSELNLAEYICTSSRFVSQIAGQGSETPAQQHGAGGAYGRNKGKEAVCLNHHWPDVDSWG